MKLGVRDERFTIDGAPTFLLGASYYGALGAPDEFVEWDLHELVELGFNWVRIWATWGAFGQNVSAVRSDGAPREPYISHIKRLCELTEELGLMLDVTLSRGNGTAGPTLEPELPAHLRAVAALARELRPFRHLYFDLSNEHNVSDRRHSTIADLAALREAVKEIDPGRLATASFVGDIGAEEIAEHLEVAGLDFLAPHRPREADSPGQTAQVTRRYLALAGEFCRLVPVHYQEPFRRGFGGWQPLAADFLTDLGEALEGGAAGWCFHNGDERARADGRPRRSFDLRASEGRLFDQLDIEEMAVVEQAAAVLQSHQQ